MIDIKIKKKKKEKLSVIMMNNVNKQTNKHNIIM